MHKVTIPDSVTAIWEKAFYACGSLEEVTISEKVWHITEDAFAGCKSLKRIIIKSKKIEDTYWVPEGVPVERQSLYETKYGRTELFIGIV